MESNVHPLGELFQQLGLPAEPRDIERFLAAHRPLPAGTRLAEAKFWTPAQAALLREGLCDDADWSAAIDLLAVLLGA